MSRRKFTLAEKIEYSSQRDKYSPAVRARYSKYVSNCKILTKLEWSLTRDYALWLMMQDCVYCGVEATKDKPNGLDRCNNTLGYTEENCLPCCTTCNMSKKASSCDEWFGMNQKRHKYMSDRCPYLEALPE